MATTKKTASKPKKTAIKPVKASKTVKPTPKTAPKQRKPYKKKVVETLPVVVEPQVDVVEYTVVNDQWVEDLDVWHKAFEAVQYDGNYEVVLHPTTDSASESAHNFEDVCCGGCSAPCDQEDVQCAELKDPCPIEVFSSNYEVVPAAKPSLLRRVWNWLVR